MALYKVRITCETETGDGKGFHLCYADQDVIDDTITCPTHPSATVRDFTVISQDTSRGPVVEDINNPGVLKRIVVADGVVAVEDV